MRLKSALLIIITAFLVLAMDLVWQIKDIQRGRADEVQLSKEAVIQPNVVDNDDVALFLIDEKETARVGEVITYTISYQAKKDFQNVRLVGSLGVVDQQIKPDFVWNLGNLPAGTAGSVSVPILIKKGKSDLVISRVVLSSEEQPSVLRQKQRKVLATCDDINQLEK